MMVKRVILGLIFISLHIVGMNDDRKPIDNSNSTFFFNPPEGTILSKDETSQVFNYGNMSSARYLFNYGELYNNMNNNNGVYNQVLMHNISPVASQNRFNYRYKSENVSVSDCLNKSKSIDFSSINLEQYISKQVESQKALAQKSLISYKQFKRLTWIEREAKIGEYSLLIERLQKTSNDLYSNILLSNNEPDCTSSSYVTENEKQNQIKEMYEKYVKVQVDLALAQHKLGLLRSYAETMILDEIIEAHEKGCRENNPELKRPRIYLFNQELARRSLCLEKPLEFMDASLKEQKKQIGLLEKQEELLEKKLMLLKTEREKSIKVYCETSRLRIRKRQERREKLAKKEKRVAIVEADKRVVRERIKHAYKLFDRKKELEEEEKILFKEMDELHALEAEEELRLLKELEVKTNGKLSLVLGDNTTLTIPLDEIKATSYETTKILAMDEEYGLGNYVSDKEVVREIDNEGLQTSQSLLCYKNKEKVFDARKSAIQKDLANKNSFRAATYEVSEKLEKAFDKKGYSISHMREFQGNELQHVVNQELINIGENALVWSYEGEGKEQLDAWKDLTLDFVYTGSCLNAAGYETRATSFADFCWTALDYGQAAIEGTVEGVQNVTEMIVHPIDTAKGMARGVVYMGAFLGDLIVDGVDIMASKNISESHLLGFEYIPEVHSLMEQMRHVAKCRYKEKTDELINKACGVYGSAKKYLEETPTRDLIRKGTAFGVEMLITRGACKNAGRFFSKIGPKAAKALNNINKGKDVVLAGVEGMNIPVVHNTIETVKCVSRNTNEFAKQLAKKTVGVTDKTKRVFVGKFERVLRKTYKGFTKLQARRIMEISGKRFVIKSKKTVDALKAVGFSGDSFKFSANYWQHVFGIEHKLVKYSSGVMRTIKGGGHHIGNKALRLKNIFFRPNQVIEGTIKNIRRSGIPFNTPKTLYPQSWSYDKIAAKIVDSFKNITKIEKSRGLIAVYTKTDCGVKILNIVDRSGKLISSYPT